MDFEIGDEVVYNPSYPDLDPAEIRRNDWGIITNISNGYIYFKFYNYGFHRILPNAFTHSPRSPKYYRNIYRSIVEDIPAATFNHKLKACKNMYKHVHQEVVQYGMQQRYNMLMNSGLAWDVEGAY
jgi:hypothetical protein